jgi:pantoate--beta-alanine ligase
VATERDENGLALSSRNGYLNAEQKLTALTIIQTLRDTAAQIKNGARDFAALEQAAKSVFESRQMRPDYLSICRADTLEPASADDKQLVILAAAYVGTTRLIDNIEVNL